MTLSHGLVLVGALCALYACSNPYTVGTVGGGEDAGAQSSGGEASSSGASGEPAQGGSGGSSSGAAGASSSGGPVSECELTPFQQRILDKVNALRAAAPGASPPLLAVPWACAATTALEAWVNSAASAERCVSLNAPPAFNDGIVSYGTASMQAGHEVFRPLEYLMDAGSANYDRDSNTCALSPGQHAPCLVYRHMVRRELSHVACAVGSVCASSDGSETRRYACAFLPNRDDDTLEERPY